MAGRAAGVSGASPGDAETSARPGFGRRSPSRKRLPTTDRLSVYVADQLEVLRSNDPVRRSSPDAEAVHETRVAVRRLRSVLRTARPMLDPDWVDDVRAELDRYGELLGAVRDLDVLIGHLWTEGRQAGGEADTGELLAPLELERDEARAKLRTAMGSQRYRALLERLESAARYLPVTRTDLSVEKLARRELRKLRKFKQRANLDDDRQLHKLRILGKRARYAAELAERSPGSRASKFIAAATKLQDTLGGHQDAVVAIRRLRGLALIADCDTAFLAGRLAEREERRKCDARNVLPAVWKRVEKRGRAAW